MGGLPKNRWEVGFDVGVINTNYINNIINNYINSVTTQPVTAVASE